MNAGKPPRERLLAATIEHFAAHGVGDLSLRRLAEGVGTSHRMLIYHFGSRDGLLVAVVQDMEERQRAGLAEIVRELGDDVSAVELTRRMWQRLVDPAIAPYERLFFELYGRALQGDPHSAPLLEGIVESWLGPCAALLERTGMSARLARTQARVGLAAMRGLLLDLLATGDRAGCDEALERLLLLYELD
ncbi:TetR/AcrR family transcriptional regulator [Yinghuangia sp. YIM S09857]|uniref:TetR/AcrR family transcriptional regulator n=1 Tax=Yinghuangia sp. YIM S09857 TaxID=3436929 RepID=UPI003F532F3D